MLTKNTIHQNTSDRLLLIPFVFVFFFLICNIDILLVLVHLNKACAADQPLSFTGNIQYDCFRRFCCICFDKFEHNDKNEICINATTTTKTVQTMAVNNKKRVS